MPPAPDLAAEGPLPDFETPPSISAPKPSPQQTSQPSRDRLTIYEDTIREMASRSLRGADAATCVLVREARTQVKAMGIDYSTRKRRKHRRRRPGQDDRGELDQ